MRRVAFLPRAQGELNEAAAFYDKARPGLGRDFLGELQRALDHVAEQPEAGARLDESTRALPIPRCPYLLVYRLFRNRIVVAAAAHQRRRPGYWRG